LLFGKMPTILKLPKKRLKMHSRIIKKTAETVKIKNPCKGTCKYTKQNLCIGCYRTKAEIVGWVDFSDEEKSRIILQAESRKRSDKNE